MNGVISMAFLLVYGIEQKAFLKDLSCEKAGLFLCLRQDFNKKY